MLPRILAFRISSFSQKNEKIKMERKKQEKSKKTKFEYK
jgi:hypothetical protein